MKFGFQTQEFIDRLRSYEDTLPAELVSMALIMKGMIEDIPSPTPEDIKRLHSALAEVIRTEDALISLCGTEGEKCRQCPFGAYLPKDVLSASPEAPFCLPWITVRMQEDSGGG